MLALKSSDAAADRADFEKHGLPVYEPFHFERMAKGPDGVERKVAFSLTFTSDARVHGAGRLLHLPASLPGEFLAARNTSATPTARVQRRQRRVRHARPCRLPRVPDPLHRPARHALDQPAREVRSRARRASTCCRRSRSAPSSARTPDPTRAASRRTGSRSPTSATTRALLRGERRAVQRVVRARWSCRRACRAIGAAVGFVAGLAPPSAL